VFGLAEALSPGSVHPFCSAALRLGHKTPVDVLASRIGASRQPELAASYDAANLVKRHRFAVNHERYPTNLIQGGSGLGGDGWGNGT
jgi:hypothetical protein